MSATDGFVTAELSALREAEIAYRDGTPVMSDEEFDARRDYLADNFYDHDGVADFADNVASGVLEGGDVTHAIPMLSLKKATGKDGELPKWIAKLPVDAQVSVSLKLDGVALSLRYKDGEFVQAVTRGNGRQGFDVTHSIDQIDGIPLWLGYETDIEVRGEVVMTQDNFSRAGENRGKPFSNRRNPIGPALGRATKDRDYDVPMTFIAYGIATDATDDLTDDLELLEGLEFYSIARLSEFTTDHDLIGSLVSDLEAVCKDPDAEFLCDGVVIAATDKTVRDEMGEGNRAPKWAIAYKFPAVTAVGVLADIETAVGKTGAISYTAVLAEPIAVDGSMVQRASLHNPAHIADNDFRIGDTVTVAKMNDIIPQLLSVDLTKRPTTARIYSPDHNCPSCGEKLDFSNVRPVCHEASCSLVSRLTAAAARSGFDWDGISESLIERAVDAGANDLADLFAMTADDWAKLPKVTGSAPKIAGTIAKSLTETALHQVLGALGVRYVRETFARRLADHYGSLEAVRAASLEDLQNVDGVGDGRAEAIHAGLARMSDVLDRLVEMGLKPINPTEVEAAGDALAGHKVLVTGALDGMSRSDVKNAIVANGGKPASSPSKTCTMFVIGDNAGPAKVEKINALAAADSSIQVLSGDEFLNMFAEG